MVAREIKAFSGGIIVVATMIFDSDISGIVVILLEFYDDSVIWQDIGYGIGPFDYNDVF